MYIIFHWIFTISYFQCKQISQQVRTICTSNAHKFPLNFLDLIHYLIFHWISSNLYIQRIQIFLQIRTSCMSNAQNFPFNFHDFVHSTNLNFLNRFIWSVLLMYINFHLILTIWFVFQVCISNVPNFPQNFHDNVLPMKLNFSTSLEYLYI